MQEPSLQVVPGLRYEVGTKTWSIIGCLRYTVWRVRTITNSSVCKVNLYVAMLGFFLTLFIRTEVRLHMHNTFMHLSQKRLEEAMMSFKKSHDIVAFHAG